MCTSVIFGLQKNDLVMRNNLFLWAYFVMFFDIFAGT